jgi:hypothetical protein
VCVERDPPEDAIESLGPEQLACDRCAFPIGARDCVEQDLGCLGSVGRPFDSGNAWAVAVKTEQSSEQSFGGVLTIA